MKKVILLFLAFFLVSGCTKEGINENKGVTTIGYILSMDDHHIYVKSNTTTDYGVYAITNSTQLIKNNKKITFNDLHLGDKVEVTVYGAIRESYPVQADANKIKVLNSCSDQKICNITYTALSYLDALMINELKDFTQSSYNELHIDEMSLFKDQKIVKVKNIDAYQVIFKHSNQMIDNVYVYLDKDLNFLGTGLID